MVVEEWMTRSPHAVGPGDSLQTAAETMDRHEIGCILVTDDDERLVGVITDRDICLAASREQAPLTRLRIAAFMSTRARTCRPTDSLEKACEIMRTHHIRRLAVVDDGNVILGIVSLDDLAHARGQDGLSADDLASTLAAVSARRAYG